MISPEVKAEVGRVNPLLDPHVAGALAQRLDPSLRSHPTMGRLEDLAMHCGIVQGSPTPSVKRKAVFIFCGDHGVVEEGVSHGPGMAASRRMTDFFRGADPLAALCRRLNIDPVVVDCGIAGGPLAGATPAHAGLAASNIAKLPGLTAAETNEALMFGIDTAHAAAGRYDAVGVIHIGTGASTAAAAVLSALSGHEAALTCPHADDQAESAHHRMVSAVRTAVGRHAGECFNPFGTLRCLGGWDIAAMTGFILGAAQCRLATVVDGFVTGAAALVARTLAPDSLDAVIVAHESHDPAHALLHGVLRVEPYMNLHLHPDSGYAAALLLGIMETAIQMIDVLPAEPQAAR
jgi:nicotinate-nucleotide--dimethylbenzimidazole phosphoribosyltransferase